MSTKVLCKTPGMQSFQFTRKTPEGEVVSEQVRFQPGEVKELSAEQFEALQEHSQFQRLVDRRMLEVNPETSDTALRNAREEIAHGSLSSKWIKRFSKKAQDLGNVAQEEVNEAQRALETV